MREKDISVGLPARKYSFVFAVVCIAAVIGTALQPSYAVSVKSLSTNLQPMSLAVIGLNGTQVVLNASDIENLPSYTAAGGSRKKTGAVSGPDNYTGVSLEMFCNLVGGISEDNTLWVTSSDNYSTVFSYAQTEGDFVTYNATGQQVQHSQSLTPILAYHKNGQNISSSEGPLRIAIVGSENLFTDSSYWAKLVVRIEIRLGHNVAVKAVTPVKTVVGQNHAVQIDVTAENTGGYTETVNVTIQVNATLVGTINTVVLANGTSRTVTFVWDTTGFVKGNYTLMANVTLVPAETNKADNTLFSAWIVVATVGDLTGPGNYPDGKVDITDLTLAAKAFGSSLGNPRWNPNVDIDGDGEVDILDLVLIAGNLTIGP